MRWVRRRGIAAALVGLSGIPGEHEAELPLAVPRTVRAIALDGDASDLAWADGCTRTGAFLLQSGKPAVPYAEARFAWDERSLYLLLYAADDDVREGTAAAADAFRIAIELAGGRYVIDVSPRGVVTDAAVRGDDTLDDSWESRAVVGYDVDGTVNDPAHEDEEWILEMAIPFASLGMRGEPGQSVTLSLARHEVSRDRDMWSTWGPRRLALEP